MIVYQDGNYLYPGQYSQTICQAQIGWYLLHGGNILMARPRKADPGVVMTVEDKKKTGEDYRSLIFVLIIYCLLLSPI